MIPLPHESTLCPRRGRGLRGGSPARKNIGLAAAAARRAPHCAERPAALATGKALHSHHWWAGPLAPSMKAALPPHPPLPLRFGEWGPGFLGSRREWFSPTPRQNKRKMSPRAWHRVGDLGEG